MITSCGSLYELTVDENSPADQNAKIFFKSWQKSGWFRLLAWNDIEINNQLYGNKKMWGDGDEVVLTVPAGIGKVTFDVEFRTNDSSYISRDVDVQYNFEAGKSYQIEGRIVESTTLILKIYTARMYVRLYDITSAKRFLEEKELRTSHF